MTVAILDRDDGVSPKGMAWGRFRRNRMAVCGALVLGVLVVVCFASLPWTVRHYGEQHLGHVKEGPSGAFWFGTDGLGRDLFARFLLGGAISLLIGLSSAGI